MPGVTGRLVADAVRRARPDVGSATCPAGPTWSPTWPTSCGPATCA